MKYITLLLMLITSASYAKISRKCELCLSDYRRCRIGIIENDPKYVFETTKSCQKSLNHCSDKNKCEDKR